MKIKEIKKSGFEKIVRMYPYATEDDALLDVTRLAEAMSYKSAAAHLKLGGGKAVIIGDSSRDKTPQLLKAMGRFINQLEGSYYSAKDLGFVTEDLVAIAKETKYVTGLPDTMGGSGDPSPWTARGIIEGMRACIKEKLGRSDFRDVRVAIQGIGHVGYALARLLREEGAGLIVSDVDTKALERARSELKAEIVSPDQVITVPCDVLSPCAVGSVINRETIPKLRCQIIAGGANNQLENDAQNSEQLFRKEILYASDYILNAGGVINIYVRDILKKSDSMPWIIKISGHLEQIFKLSKQNNTPPAQIANQLTEEILAGKIRL
jgi:leucine dehydrogenase